MSINRPQTWQLINQKNLEALETGERETLSNMLDILDSKINFPFRTKLDRVNNQLEVFPSEIQVLQTDPTADEWGSTIASYKAGTAPINGQYKIFAHSTLNFTTGQSTGSYDTNAVFDSAPTLQPNEYVWMGIEATNFSSGSSLNDGTLQVIWGNSSFDKNAATFPTFSSGTPVGLVLLKAALPGTWNFQIPSDEDIIIFRGSGGGGAGGGTLDFIPQYKSSSQFRLLDTQNRRSKFNDKYFYISENLDFNYTIPSSPILDKEYTYYICLDTNLPGGEINSTNTDIDTASGYIRTTDIDPAESGFPDNLAVLGYFIVVNGEVTQQNLGTYSVKEIDTFLGDLAPTYNNSTTFRIQGTSGRLVELNKNYYYLDEDLVVDFDLSSTGYRTICLDTRTGTPELSGFVSSWGGIEVHEEHIVQTTLKPGDISFPQNLIPLGGYLVNSDLEVSVTGFATSSDRNADRMLGEFVPSYVDGSNFRVNRTRGLKVKLIDNYFWSDHDIESTFNTSNSGQWFICIDTAAAVGESPTGYAVDSTFIVCTQESPSSTSFPPDYVAIGEYYVEASGSDVQIDTFKPYSISGAGSGGGYTDLAPNYKNQDYLAIRSTSGRRVLINGRYYYTVNEIEKAYDKTIDGTWYISIDTNPENYGHTGNEGELDASDIQLTSKTVAVPRGAHWNPFYVPVGEYEVQGGQVIKTEFKGYSTREMMTWAYGLPNIKRKHKIHVAPEPTSSFSFDFNHAPSSVNYRYWDNSSERFYQFPRGDVERYINKNTVYYTIPTDSKITWDTDDYFEVEVIYYAYSDEGGFASPKTDHTTEWYQATPPAMIEHPLAYRPQNITLEFRSTRNPAPPFNTVDPFYYVVDGNQYVDKNPTKGIQDNVVYFDWEALPQLSSDVRMKIHFNLSKVSSGAFEADRNELGTVKVTGSTTTALTPDVILTSIDTEFATRINGSGDNISVLIKESIVVSTEQNITSKGVNFNMLPGAYIICETPLSSPIVRFSGEDYEVENIRILSKEDVDVGLGLSNDGIVKNALIKQNFEGVGTKTMGTALRVYSGSIATVSGRSKEFNNGIIVTKITDDDGNSEISIS